MAVSPYHSQCRRLLLLCLIVVAAVVADNAQTRYGSVATTSQNPNGENSDGLTKESKAPHDQHISEKTFAPPKIGSSDGDSASNVNNVQNTYTAGDSSHSFSEVENQQGLQTTYQSAPGIEGVKHEQTPHHLARRSFDSIDQQGCKMCQNYAGSHDQKSKASSLTGWNSAKNKELADQELLDSPDQLSWNSDSLEGYNDDSDRKTNQRIVDFLSTIAHLPPWFQWSIDPDFSDLHSGDDHSEDLGGDSYTAAGELKISPDKRGFDSIGGWNSGLSGISQNFFGPKRGDYRLHSRWGQIRDSRPHPVWTTKRSLKNQQAKRSFDSILTGSHMSGMNQNHLSKRFGPSSHTVTQVPELVIRELQDIAELLGDDDDEYRADWDVSSYRFGSEGSGVSRSKRLFDSILPRQFSGMGQNHISTTFSNQAKARRNIFSNRNFDSIYAGKGLGGLSQNHISKRFDSIGISALGGMAQNFYDNNRLSSDIRFGQSGQKRSHLRNVNHYITKRSVSPHEENKAQEIDGVHKRSAGSRLRPEGRNKRQFDSIATSRLGGISQNFVGKRQFDSIATDGPGGINQNFVGKRQFDSIANSRLGGMSQNFVGKRHFDSIAADRLGGIGQNFVGKRTFDSAMGSRLGGMNQKFVGKRQFDSIYGNSRLGGMGQNFVGKRQFDSIAGISRMGGMGQNFVGKRQFDSIAGSSRIGGIGQNFVGKRQFDSINGDSGLGGMSQNFVGKRQFDSINGDGSLGGMNQHFVGKRQFDSIYGDTGLGGMSQNFVGKRHFDSINAESGLRGMGQNFVGKRQFDPIYGDSGLGGMSQNFVGKRQFDTIGLSRMGGMNQNFVGKRFKDAGRQRGDSRGSQSYIGRRHSPIGKRSTSDNSVDRKQFAHTGKRETGALRQLPSGTKHFDLIDNIHTQASRLFNGANIFKSKRRAYYNFGLHTNSLNSHQPELPSARSSIADLKRQTKTRANVEPGSAFVISSHSDAPTLERKENKTLTTLYNDSYTDNAEDVSISSHTNKLDSVSSSHGDAFRKKKRSADIPNNLGNVEASDIKEKR